MAFAIAMPLANGWYPPEHQGKALGLTATGAMITALLAPPLAEAHGWQAVAGLAMLPVGGSLLVFWTLAKDSPERLAPRTFAHYLHVLRYADAVWFCFFYAVTFGGVISLASSLHDHFALAPPAGGGGDRRPVPAGGGGGPVPAARGVWNADRFGGIRTPSPRFWFWPP